MNVEKPNTAFDDLGPFADLKQLESILNDIPKSDHEGESYQWHLGLLSGRSMVERFHFEPSERLEDQIDAVRPQLRNMAASAPDITAILLGVIEGLAVHVQFGGAAHENE